jgi:signal transduction histidine kinase
LDDRDELLTAAEESLDLLAHLAASLLDVSRLQAGTLVVFPQPADLGEIVAGSLDVLGPQARAVLSDIRSGLPRSAAPAGCGPRSRITIVQTQQGRVAGAPAGGPVARSVRSTTRCVCPCSDRAMRPTGPRRC